MAEKMQARAQLPQETAKGDLISLAKIRLSTP